MGLCSILSIPFDSKSIQDKSELNSRKWVDKHLIVLQHTHSHLKIHSPQSPQSLTQQFICWTFINPQSALKKYFKLALKLQYFYHDLRMVGVVRG